MKEISKSAEADLLLVETIRNKNKREAERAFNALFKKYHDSVLFHFRGLVKDEEDAKELVMMSFEKMNLNLEKYNKEQGVFSTWLFQLTKNVFIDTMRKKAMEKKRMDNVSLSDMASYGDESHVLEYDIKSNDETPESKILLLERNKRINEAIDTLKKQEFVDVIRLRFFEGLTYEEIAGITERPLSSIKVIIFRAKKALRKELIKKDVAY